MKLPFPADAAATGGGSGFLLLAWCELFDDFTPDNYQPRLYHVPALVAEVADVSQRAITADRWKQHLDHLLAELKTAVESETSFLDAVPPYAWSLRQLLRLDGTRNVAVLARTLRADAAAYEEEAMAALRRAATGLPRAKDDALDALRRLATVVIQAGRTAAECLALVTPALLARPAQEVVEELIRFARPSSRQYRCRLTVAGEPRFAQQILRKAGFSLVTQDAGATGGDASGVPATIIVEIEQTAGMPQEAARRAVAVLRRATNIFNFYCNRPELVQRAGCWVIDERGQRTRIELDNGALRRQHPRNHAPALTGLVLDHVSPERLGGRLLNALEHCSLAQTSTIPRVQLVNLWSAVECLSGSSHGHSILTQAINVLVPTVIYQRCEKTLRYLAIQIARLRRADASRSLGEGFVHSQPIRNFVRVEELLVALCRPKDHPHIVQLLSFAAPNPLLCHRLFDLWKLFSRPAGLQAKLRAARKTTEWHIARIYRARNLMIHEGTEIGHIPWMLDHLHAYFTAVCGRVLEALRTNPAWTVEEALTSWELRGDYLVEGLGQFPNRLTVADILREPAILGGELLWPAPVPPPAQTPPSPAGPAS